VGGRGRLVVILEFQINHVNVLVFIFGHEYYLHKYACNIPSPRVCPRDELSTLHSLELMRTSCQAPVRGQTCFFPNVLFSLTRSFLFVLAELRPKGLNLIAVFYSC